MMNDEKDKQYNRRFFLSVFSPCLSRNCGSYRDCEGH